MQVDLVPISMFQTGMVAQSRLLAFAFFCWFGHLFPSIISGRLDVEVCLPFFDIYTAITYLKIFRADQYYRWALMCEL